MVRRLIYNLRRHLNAFGKKVEFVLKDDRGIWSLPVGLFIVVIAMVFVVLKMDIDNARYVRSVAYSAADAASLAGAAQYQQVVTAVGAYGEPIAWKYVVDQNRATDHATTTMYANLNDLLSKGITLESYSITYPDEFRCRVEITVRYPARTTSKAMEVFFNETQTFEAVTTVYAQSKVRQP